MPEIIGVDCDEVLCETMNELLKYPPFSTEGTTRQEITDYELSKISGLCISLQESMEIFFRFFASEHFRETKPVIGAREKLYEWKSQGFSLIMISGRSPEFRDITEQWVSQFFPNMFDAFLFSGRNTMYQITKSELCKKAGVQIMIEDDPNFVVDLVEHGIPCFLLDKPRNQNYITKNSP
jgi:uncharacterized HAD superfamily protein